MGKDAMLICDDDCLGLIESKLAVLKEFGSDIEYSILG